MQFKTEMLHMMATAIDAKCRTNNSYTWPRASHQLLEHAGADAKSVRMFVKSFVTSTSTKAEDYLDMLKGEFDSDI
jgi:hypothetical protein